MNSRVEADDGRRREAREALYEAFRSSDSAQVGERLYIGSTEEIKKIVQRALRAGKPVRYRGVVQWIECFAHFDGTKDGSDRYTWDESGDRVRADRVLVGDNGSRKVIGQCWIKWEDA